MTVIHTALGNPNINAGSASPGAPSAAASNSHVPNPGFAPVNNIGDDISEERKQRLVELLQRTAQGGLQNSAQVSSALTPHLPAILALAKSGKLDATQLVQIGTVQHNNLFSSKKVHLRSR
ncbi:hypothetical protein FRC08_018870, partial [Ceratobasidium sp. 394]